MGSLEVHRRYRATPEGATTCREVARRWRVTPRGRVLNVLRSRLRDALAGRDTLLLRELVGCTAGELRAHVESTFQPGWSWENRGAAWEVDHKVPCARFDDLSDPAQQRECFHWSNLRAYPKDLNGSDGARYTLFGPPAADG